MVFLLNACLRAVLIFFCQQLLSEQSKYRLIYGFDRKPSLYVMVWSYELSEDIRDILLDFEYLKENKV